MRIKHSIIHGAGFVAVVGLCGLQAGAARLGHAGYSTTGATATQTQWNLLCDPQYAEFGSTSTAYSGLGVATINSILPESPFKVTDLEVELLHITNLTPFWVDFKPNSAGVIVADHSKFFDPNNGVPGIDAGFLQVSWQLADTNSPPPDATDDNTHMLVFDNASGNPNESATFLDYADPGIANGGHSLVPDFYSGKIINPDGSTSDFTYSGDPNSPDYRSFDTNSQTLVVGTPEPSSMALLGLAGAGLLKRRRK
ncbi:MAG: hypothetical protein JWL69_4168 [Phycisphaerales bacterium]|nr:hypothetical protein [Phycisphaerales bacterium]MDB5357655.1 hypothetical protein [Phycisphaerales bacterium]